MKVEQIAIFIENKSGRLAEITSILADNDINIRALSVADTADFGILRLIVDKVDKAKTVLKGKGFTIGGTMVIAVQVEDKTGGLASVLNILNAGGLSVEYMYSIINKLYDGAIMVMRFDDVDKAIEILQKNDITIMTGEQICSM